MGFIEMLLREVTQHLTYLPFLSRIGSVDRFLNAQLQLLVHDWLRRNVAKCRHVDGVSSPQ